MLDKYSYYIYILRMFKFTPLFKFRGTTMWKAWVINSIILGLISAFTIEIRRIYGRT